MHADGTGVVALQVKLDKEAAAAVPDLAKDLRTGDLVTAGWKVDEPKVSNGITTFGVHRSFDGAAQANALIGELTGPTGAFRNFQISQSSHTASVDTSFSGSADLSKGIDSFGDPGLQQRVGHLLGFDSKELQSSLGIDWQTQFPVEVAVRLPGGNRQSSPATGDDRSWVLQYGQVSHLEASASGVDSRPLVYVTLAVLCLAGLLVVLWKWRDSYRPRHGQHGGKGISVRDFIDLTSGDRPEPIELTPERHATRAP